MPQQHPERHDRILQRGGGDPETVHELWERGQRDPHDRDIHSRDQSSGRVDPAELEHRCGQRRGPHGDHVHRAERAQGEERERVVFPDGSGVAAARTRQRRPIDGSQRGVAGCRRVDLGHPPPRVLLGLFVAPALAQLLLTCHLRERRLLRAA